MLSQLERVTDALVFSIYPIPTSPFQSRSGLCWPSILLLSLPHPIPVQLFSQLPFVPFGFLTEPLSFENFAICLEKYVGIYG